MPARPSARISLRLGAVLLTLCLTILGSAGLSPATPTEPRGNSELNGKLEIVHGDAFGDASGHVHEHGNVPDHVLPQMQYWLDTGADKVLLEFPGHPPAFAPGANVTVKGEQHGRAFHVAEMREAAAAGGNGGGKGKPSKPPTTSYLGVRDLIVLPFQFAGQAVPLPGTVEEIRWNTFTAPDSVANFFSQNSFGLTRLKGRNDGGSDEDGLVGDVAPWMTISGNTSSCNYSSWATAAQEAARAEGWDLTGYEHIAYVFPKQLACNFSGLAQIGGTQTWMNGTIGRGVISHELGHNMTLYHARSLSCTGPEGIAVAMSSSCTYAEYGDPFDTMGHAGNYLHFNVRNKGHLSWMTGANVVTAASGQTYTIFPQESPSSELQLLRIRRGSEFLYVEARSIGLFGPADDLSTGALIHTGPDLVSNGNSYVIDTAPYGAQKPPTYPYLPEFLDAALQPGEAFIDTANGISIETISDNADGSVTVLVRTGVTNTAPAANAGGSHPLTVGTPHTHDGASASDTTKNLSSYRWSWVSCSGTCPTLTGTQGQLSGGGTSVPVPGPSYTPTSTGTYRLSLTVWDAAGAKTIVTVDESVGA